jgi:metal-responsive CopG/Arc/MetJ family transcriptional regulator
MSRHDNKLSRTRSFLGVSLPPEIVQRFDEERGLVSRSTWFKHILETRYGSSIRSNNNSNTAQEKEEVVVVASSLSSASQTEESGRPIRTLSSGSSSTTEEPHRRIPR